MKRGDSVKNNEESDTSISEALSNAPDEIKLAIDLIELLENSNISPKTVVKALEIVSNDYKNKL
ncbi:DUF2496 domain-containing protein [Aliivibrio kagoshimensis]|jgi:hypothetical protein|uniref:DUF2496 domain-containing protein n=1 Tax=Aliivibrio kagoshimensis TaxID=2910230 RepID=UPI003D0C192C